MNQIQQNIQELLKRLCAAGRERGIQVAAYHRGELIVNAFAGVADERTGTLVSSDTLFPVFSVTKGLVATVIHQLVESGLLTYETRIAEVWPEFGADGKQAMTIEQMLRHTAGITTLPADTSYEETCNWDAICTTIAGLPAQWEPGTRCEYHGLTYGWILGEVAQRVSGRSFSQLIQENICAPLGIQTMFVGLPEDSVSQVAWLEHPEAEVPENDGTPRVVPPSMQPLFAWMNRIESRHTCMPAGNGLMSAEALARHYAALLPGGIDGVELLLPERVNRATTQISPTLPGLDSSPTFGWGMGYLVGEPGNILGDTKAAFGVGGHGGAIGFADRSREIAVGLTRNLFKADDPALEIVNELRRLVDKS